MRILALDISKNAPGWATFENDERLDSGTLLTSQETVIQDGIPYPYSVLDAADSVALICFNKVKEVRPHLVVVEQINLGKNRNTQRILDWIHMAFARLMKPYAADLKYLSTGTWRKLVGVTLSKDDKRLNSKLSRAKSKAKQSGQKLDKKALGIRGRVNKKHVAIRWANEQFNLDLKVKNNDEAEALALGRAAWIALSSNLQVFCDGTGI